MLRYKVTFIEYNVSIKAIFIEMDRNQLFVNIIDKIPYGVVVLKIELDTNVQVIE